MVQATSAEAYGLNAANFKNMGDRIMAYMNLNGLTRTRSEIARDLQITTATMSGRINHLLKKGKLVEEPGKFKCSVTRNMVRGVSAV